MMDPDRKRELKRQVRQSERESFLARMPLTPEMAYRLFDTVNASLEVDHCHEDTRYTIRACEQLNLPVETMLFWLRENGGGCDCEMTNVEEKVEEAIGAER